MDREVWIRERAYYLWEQEGRPNDRAVAHWTTAEHCAMAELGSNETGDQKAAPAKQRSKQTASKAGLSKSASGTRGRKTEHATLQ